MGEPRELNIHALEIILAVQAFYRFTLCDVVDGETNARARKYFKSIPACLMEQAGLNQTTWELRNILNYEVTEEMMKAFIWELSKFKLWPEKAA